jgi:hypothetical protein
MEKVHAFIKLVDANYFGKQKEQELIQLYESLATIPAATVTPIAPAPPVVTTTVKSTCQFIMKNGARKGEMCGKGCMKCNSLCSLHKEKPVEDVKKDTPKVNEEKQVIDLTVPNIVSDKTESINIEKTETLPKDKTTKEKKEVIPKEKTTKEKKEKATKDKKETSGEPCPNVLKTGDQIGTVCGNTTKSCPHHKPIHIRKSGDWSVLTGTNVLFDKKKQVVIGYLLDEKQVFEENDEVRAVCITYDLLYAKM